MQMEQEGRRTKGKKLEYKILFEDEHHVVVDKPPGMGCLPDRRDMGRDNLFELMQKQYEDSTLVHRLDIQTSGIVLVAKHKEAMRHLSLQFQERTIKKEYLTYVTGYVGFDEVTIDRPVGPILRQGATTIRRKGKSSVTRFIKDRTYKTFTRLRCFPSTGRTHQIRIHLSDMGLPIVCDEKYGGEFPFLSKIKKKYNRSKKDSRSEERPILNRVALHARALEYMPFEGTEPKMIECPESNDLLKFTEKLEKYSS